MKVLFIVPYPTGLSPSQRFRFEQYLGIMKHQGYRYEIHSFLLPHNWRLFSEPGRFISKILVLVTGYARRMGLMTRIKKFDRVFIHREAAPLGPPVFEWFIAKVLKVKIIYDFDDAIWLTDNNRENGIERLMRWRGKVSSICSMASVISCGNEYLAAFARRHNTNVVVNPTTIDSNLHRRANGKGTSSNPPICIGWTGTQSTLKYLRPLEKPLARFLSKHPDVKVRVIADKKPDFQWPSTEFVAWSLGTEITDLVKIDIGLMPLPDDEWAKGKCGFKALQFMALGIPTIASPVGVNKEIIEHGRNGFLATTEEDWVKSLEELYHNETLRKQFGMAGQETVRNRYSISSNKEHFLSLFRDARKVGQL